MNSNSSSSSTTSASLNNQQSSKTDKMSNTINSKKFLNTRESMFNPRRNSDTILFNSSRFLELPLATTNRRILNTSKNMLQDSSKPTSPASENMSLISELQSRTSLNRTEFLSSYEKSLQIPSPQSPRSPRSPQSPQSPRSPISPSPNQSQNSLVIQQKQVTLKNTNNKSATSSHGLMKNLSSKSLSRHIQNLNNKILGKRHSLSIFKFYQNATSPTQINSNDYEFFRLNNALSKSNSRLEKSTSDQFFKAYASPIVLEQEKAVIKRNESRYKLNFKIKSNLTFNQKAKKANERSKSVPSRQRNSIFAHINKRKKLSTPKNLRDLRLPIRSLSYCKYCNKQLQETNRKMPSVLLNR